MEKISKHFFDGEVLICGCEAGDNLYYKRLYKAFSKNGIKVYPMPTTPESELGFDTYKTLEDLPKVPNSAYVLSPKNEEAAMVERLIALGVRKMLFFSAEDSTFALCKSKGIETRVGCPMMLFGAGFCWLHAVFAGVKQEKSR